MPTYWFLISKGYKTYLLMTNNFPIHFPCFERGTPDKIQKLMDSFYLTRYPENYDPRTGLICVPQGKVSLKIEVADIDQCMQDRQPRIKFFVEKNPNWRDGIELACIARVDLTIPIRFALKRMIKFFKRMF